MTIPEVHQELAIFARISFGSIVINELTRSLSCKNERQTSSKFCRNILIGALLVLYVVDTSRWLTKNPYEEISFYINILGGGFIMGTSILLREDLIPYIQKREHYSIGKTVLQLLGVLGLFASVFCLWFYSENTPNLALPLFLWIFSSRMMIFAINPSANVMSAVINIYKLKINKQFLANQLNRDNISSPIIRNQTRY